MLEPLDFQIIEYLRNESESISSERIAEAVSKSSKTVLNRLKSITKEILNHGAKIEKIHGSGFKLVIYDKDQFERFLKHSNSFEYNDTQSEDYLIKQLCSILVMDNEYNKVENLTELLYVSRSKMTSLLNEVRKILEQYDLVIESRPHYGLKLKGSEFNIRRFIASNYIQNSVVDSTNELLNSYIELGGGKNYFKPLNTIRQIVKEELIHSNEKMSDNIFNNFVMHLCILLHRYKEGMTIDSISIEKEKNSDYYLVKRVLDAVEREFNVIFPENEVDYILIHFISKKELEISEQINIPMEINQLIDHILKRINEDKKIDLVNDLDLRTMLGLHLVPLIERIRYKTELKNPLLEEIKAKCIVGYDCAIICANVIDSVYQTELSENEISYFALHFDVALNKKQAQTKKKNVLVVCASGRASAQLLKIKFEQHFNRYLEHIDVCDISEVDEFIVEHNYDFIFTTVPLTTRSGVPVFDFDFFLDQQSVRKIQNVLIEKNQVNDFLKFTSEKLFFANQKWGTREESIHKMVEKIEGIQNLPNNFEELILERESFNSTDLFELVALPHPNAVITDETFIAIATLEKPILWNNRKVRLIIMISVSKWDSEKYKFIFGILIQLLNSHSEVLKICQEGTYTGFVNKIYELELNGE